MSNDRKSLLKALVQAGWRVMHGERHYKCFAPGGVGIVVIESSGSGNEGRALKNTLSRIRRYQPSFQF
jgi:hypothetical protein